MSHSGLRVIESGIDKAWDEISISTLDVVRLELDNDNEALSAIESFGFTNEAEKLKKFVECRYGDLSHQADIIADKCSDDQEFYPCVNRGSCKHEGKICKAIHGPFGTLSRREVQVTGLVGEGLSDKEIAAKMFLSVLTINSHVKHIIAKMGYSGRTALAAFANRKNISNAPMSSELPV